MYYAGKTGLLATMHGKQMAMAPVLSSELGLALTVPAEFDTDRFGTFTREVPRPGNQLDTLRKKAQAAMAASDARIIVASEGSFGPHPLMPMIPGDLEMVLLLDADLGIEVVGQTLSPETNFSTGTVTSWPDAHVFAERSGFPAHGIIAGWETGEGEKRLYKSLETWDALENVVLRGLVTAGEVWLETDMRAHRNPKRMRVIAEATRDLVRNFNRLCPACALPGMLFERRELGLPCEDCGFPTKRSRVAHYRCQRCPENLEMLHPEGLATAPAGECPFCNP